MSTERDEQFPLESAKRARQTEQVAKAFANLPTQAEPQREALALRFISAFGHDEQFARFAALPAPPVPTADVSCSSDPPAVAEARERSSGWISVEDRLPEPDSGEVLVWLTVGYAALDEWHTYREDPTGMGGPTMDMGVMWRTFDFEDITHWQPLPPPPLEAHASQAQHRPDALSDSQVQALITAHTNAFGYLQGESLIRAIEKLCTTGQQGEEGKT